MTLFKYSRIMSILHLLFALILFGVSSIPTQAADFTVSTAAELIAAINTANANGVADTITLTSDIILTDFYETSTFLGSIGLPQITSNITINGNGFVIEREPSSSPAFRIITINGGTLTINDATIRNGFAADGLLSGGGNIILTNNSTLNLFNSLIENGVATSGAGILNFSGTMNIDNSRIQSNLTVNPNQDGGGIYNAGVATITNSLISSNLILGSNGAGVYNTGTMTITNSTISSNVAGTSGEGAGIYNDDTLTLNNVTITENETVLSLSSGIYNSGTATVNNSIISGNRAVLGGGECSLPSGTFTAPANNIFGVSGNNGGCTGGTVLAGIINTLLAPSLTNNGGPTLTHALVPGSPALNASGGGATSSDQRGAAAVGIRDIGAFEFSSIAPTVAVGTVSASSLIEDGGVVTIPVTVGNLASGDSVTIIANISGGTATVNTDYTISGSLTFNADGIQNFVITGLPDTLTEGDETLTLSFSLVGAANIFGNGNQTITITDVIAPTFAKAFAPDLIAVGSTSTLTFTIDNTASSLAATSLDFTDNLPAGMVVATPANASTTCTGGTLTAVSGTGTIAYTGGTAPAGATCAVQVDVTSATSDSYVNTSGDLTSSLGNSGTANDTLTVASTPLFSKAFAPDTIAVGSTSTLTFTIDNTASSLAATSLDFTDNLPAGMVVATPANASTTCTGGTLTATDGSGSISYTGGTVLTVSSCTVSIDVEGVIVGTHTNITGDLTSSFGNSGTATDTLTVNGPPTFTKAFSPNSILVNATSTLTLTIDNTANIAVNSLDFTDNLPAGMVIATPANASTTCTGGTLTAVDGAGVISYSGGTVPASSSCMLSLDVEGVIIGTHTNITSDLTSSLGNSGTATNTLTVTDVPPPSVGGASDTSAGTPPEGFFGGEGGLNLIGTAVNANQTGNSATWQFAIINNTGAPVDGVTARITYPDDSLEGISATSSLGINGVFSRGSLLVDYALGTLPTGTTTLNIVTRLPNRAGIFNGTLNAFVNGAQVVDSATLSLVTVVALPNTGETPAWAVFMRQWLGLD